MLKSVILCSVIFCLVSAEVRTQIRENEILLSDTGNTLAQYDFNSTYSVQRDDGSDRVSIIVSPIIHNVAQGYVVGDAGNKPIATTPSPITTTASPGQLIVNSISAFINKSMFLVQCGINSAARFIRTIIRFIICTFVPICGIFNIFGDEEITESLVSPEGVVRGLDFLEGFIEKYHALHG